MNFDLFIHGVPKGNDCWGEQDDRIYFEQFYTTTNKGKKYTIETRKVNNKIFCYYNFIQYDNFIDVDSRPGSYFGITLRFDCYCKDYNAIYIVLQNTYKMDIVGLLLEENETNNRYLIRDFSSKNNEIKNIEQKIVERIEKLILPKSFVSIDNSFNLNTSKYVGLNSIDCTEDKVFLAIRQYSKVAISDDILTNREKKIQENSDIRIREIINEAKKEIKQKDEDLIDEQKRISELEQQNKGLDNNNKELKEQIKILRDDRNSEINNIIRPLIEKLKIYIKIADENKQKINDTKKDKKNFNLLNIKNVFVKLGSRKNEENISQEDRQKNNTDKPETDKEDDIKQQINAPENDTDRLEMNKEEEQTNKQKNIVETEKESNDNETTIKKLSEENKELKNREDEINNYIKKLLADILKNYPEAETSTNKERKTKSTQRSNNKVINKKTFNKTNKKKR